MAFSNIFNPKAVNNEHKGGRPPFVKPKSRRGCTFVIAMCNEPFLQEIIGKLS